jgi:hypothetical protein
MGTFADTLQSSISTSLMGTPALGGDSPTSTPSAPAETPAPASTPAETPASPTVPTLTETPAPTEGEDDFAWPEGEQPPAEPLVEEPAPTDPAQQIQADDPSKWKPEDIDKMLPQQVIDKLLLTNKGRGIYQSYKVMRELEKPITEGGLGFRPSIEQIREMYQGANDLQMMVHEYRNSPQNPAYAQNFVKQWFPVGQDGQPTPAAVAVARQLAGTLDTYAPGLYREVAKPIMSGYIEELYRQAEQETNADDRVVKFNVARIIEDNINGKHREIPEDMWKNGKAAQPQADPQAAEIAQKIKRIEDFERGQQSAAVNGFIARLNGGIASALTPDIKFALKPIAEAYVTADGKPNRAYFAIEKEFHNEVVQSVLANPAQLRQYVIARDTARASGTPDDIKAAAKAWATAARPVMQQLRLKYIKDALTSKVSESERRHTVLDEASQKRGSTSVGQPTGKNLAQGPSQPQPGESYEESLQRRIAAVMNV